MPVAAYVTITLPAGEERRVRFWCPGCQDVHEVRVEAADRPCWSWNADLNAPTFRPSVKVTGRDEAGEKVCHSHVTDGKIAFLHDCTHGLRNQTVPLPEVDYRGWKASPAPAPEPVAHEPEPDRE